MGKTLICPFTQICEIYNYYETLIRGRNPILNVIEQRANTFYCTAKLYVFDDASELPTNDIIRISREGLDLAKGPECSHIESLNLLSRL